MPFERFRVVAIHEEDYDAHGVLDSETQNVAAFLADTPETAVINCCFRLNNRTDDPDYYKWEPVKDFDITYPDYEWTYVGEGKVYTAPHSKWETKDSGDHATFNSGMRRDTNEGKPRFDLLLPEGIPYDAQMLTRWASLMARGAVKYTERNWEKADSPEELARYKESALRHLMQWLSGEEDEDHAAAVMFNLMGAEYVRYRLGDAQ